MNDTDSTTITNASRNPNKKITPLKVLPHLDVADRPPMPIGSGKLRGESGRTRLAEQANGDLLAAVDAEPVIVEAIKGGAGTH